MKLLATLILLSGSLFAQHSFTRADIEDGGRLYNNTCAACHGANGDRVSGVDLMHGKFRRANTDDGVAAIIEKGIPGTAMPPHALTDFQAGTIVAYLRSVASEAGSVSGTGDVARGKAIFDVKGGCLGCHSVRNTGSLVGPDLTDIGAIRRAPQLERSLLEPDAEILPQNRTYRVVTRDGTAIAGRLLNHDEFSVQLIDGQGLRSFQKSNLKEAGFVEKSPMPSYQGKLNAQELSDVVSYLVSLKGIDQP
ncbi:MAG TPA: c-type cytochrome [Bryobacteraceae bacterium]|jgi:putative heme-binding domain-containing protein